MFHRNKNKKNINIPYQSQNDDSVSGEWKDRSCAIACTKMILDFLSDDEVTMSDLIAEGLLIDAHTSEHGWSHQGIVRLLRNHGVSSYSQEFKTMNIMKDGDDVKINDSQYTKEIIETGIFKILNNICSDKPVICSVKACFGDNKTSHTILLTGFDFNDNKKVLIYHDPDSRKGEIKENKEVELDHFIEYWKKLSIFVD